MNINYKVAFFVGILLLVLGIIYSIISGWKTGAGSVAIGLIATILGLVNKSKWK